MVEVEGMDKPITPILEAMQPGDTETWPIERLESVRIIVGRVKAKHIRQGVEYTMRTDKEHFVVEVMRKK
jgi:hypothetical protein